MTEAGLRGAGATAPAPGERSRWGLARAAAAYTGLRFLVFAALTAVLAAIGLGIVALMGHGIDWRSARPVVLAAAFVAAPLSMVASIRLLAGPRAALAGQVADRVGHYRAMAAERVAREDAAADALIRAQEQQRDTDHPTSHA